MKSTIIVLCVLLSSNLLAQKAGPDKDQKNSGTTQEILEKGKIVEGLLPMSLFEVMEKRVSVRKFRNDAIPKEDIEKILRYALLAPNSGNQQAWRFLVVDDRSILNDFQKECIRARECVLKARGEEVPPIGELKEYFENVFAAPVFILVLVDKNVQYKGYTDKDGALAAGWIMLAARALGYGSVFFTDSIPEEICRSFFHIPENYSRTCIIPIGVTEEWPTRPARKKLEEVVSFNKM